METVFQKFSQVDSSETRRYGGSGLGLAITKHLIEVLGGEVSVTSAQGKGTTFAFSVPVTVTQRPVVTTTSASKQKAKAVPKQPDENTPNLSILVVDDEPINRLYAQKLLERLGVSRFAFAASGSEALEIWESQKFDLIYMDCQMPDMDGYEATKRIRATEETNKRKRAVIFGFTANIMTGTKERCLEAGMDDVVNKPLSLNTFRISLGTADNIRKSTNGPARQTCPSKSAPTPEQEHRKRA